MTEEIKDLLMNNNNLDSLNELENEENEDSFLFLQNVPESIQYIITPERTESTRISIPCFETIHIVPTMRPRGRKRASEEICSKKGRHLSTSEDNILSKIQVHFLKFLIYFLNDCIFDYYKKNKICFKKFAHKVISKVSSFYFNKIKNSTIYDILTETPISTKYKNKKNTNKELAEDLNKIDWFKKLFGLKFMELFYFYYNERKQLKKIFLFDREISLTNKTKSYYFLLNKYKIDKKEIIETTKNNYHFDDLDMIDLKEKIRACYE